MLYCFFIELIEAEAFPEGMGLASECICKLILKLFGALVNVVIDNPEENRKTLPK